MGYSRLSSISALSEYARTFSWASKLVITASPVGFNLVDFFATEQGVPRAPLDSAKPLKQAPCHGLGERNYIGQSRTSVNLLNE